LHGALFDLLDVGWGAAANEGDLFPRESQTGATRQYEQEQTGVNASVEVGGVGVALRHQAV
jgi:hypothetical protein